MKRQITISFFVLLFLFVGYWWKSQSGSTVTIEGHYMQYACGDQNIDMRVTKIDHPEFQDVVGKDIAPSTNFFRQSRLIDFVKDSTIPYQTGDEEYMHNFTIIGRIKSRDPDGGCDDAVTVYVDNIKYGTGEFQSF